MLAKKIAQFWNYLVFSLRCKQTGLLPQSLKLHCPVISERPKSIVRQTERRLLVERIRLINGKLAALCADFSQTADWVKCELLPEWFDLVQMHVKTVQEKEFASTKARHRKKFERFLDKKQKTETLVSAAISDEKRAKLVINLSHATLDSHQLSVLSQGLNFTVTPTSLPKEEFVVAIEKVCHTMEVAEAESLRNEVLDTLRLAKCPPTNLTIPEQQALSRLQKNSVIMVLPADKGRAAVILDKTEYEEKVAVMLSNGKTYERLEKDPTPSYKRRLVSILNRLKEEGKISSELYSYVCLHDVFHVQRPTLQTEVWYSYGKFCFSVGGQYVYGTLKRETSVDSTIRIEAKTMEKRYVDGILEMIKKGTVDKLTEFLQCTAMLALQALY